MTFSEGCNLTRVHSEKHYRYCLTFVHTFLSSDHIISGIFIGLNVEDDMSDCLFSKHAAISSLSVSDDAQPESLNSRIIDDIVQYYIWCGRMRGREEPGDVVFAPINRICTRGFVLWVYVCTRSSTTRLDYIP